MSRPDGTLDGTKLQSVVRAWSSTHTEAEDFIGAAVVGGDLRLGGSVIGRIGNPEDGPPANPHLEGVRVTGTAYYICWVELTLSVSTGLIVVLDAEVLYCGWIIVEDPGTREKDVTDQTDDLWDEHYEEKLKPAAEGQVPGATSSPLWEYRGSTPMKWRYGGLETKHPRGGIVGC